MAILTVGRVGLDVELPHPAQWQERRAIDDREFTIRGYLRNPIQAAVETLRRELMEQQGALVSCTYTLDPLFNGFYYLIEARVESVPVSYVRNLYPFEVTLVRIGSDARVEFFSNLTGTVITNDHGLVESETTPFVAPPVNHSTFKWEVTTLTAITRVTQAGNITVFTADETGFTEDASWGATSAQFYGGSAQIWAGGYLRAGADIPNEVADWVLTNDLVRARPETSGGSPTGRLLIDIWGGSAWESEKDWAFDLAGTKLSTFRWITAIRNDPELVALRLSTDGVGASNLHTIDLRLRRGAPFVEIIWTQAGTAANMKIVRDTNEAGSTFTPAGATSAVGVVATADDGDGNKYVIATPDTHTADTTAGGVTIATTNVVKAMVGHVIDGASAISGNAATDLALQYFGYLSEKVRAVWR